MIAAAEILPENLPGAWQDDETNALSIATTLSQKVGETLPWKTVKDVIGASLQARFVDLIDGSGQWPCEFHAAQSIRLRVSAGGGDGGGGPGGTPPKVLVANAELEPSEIQDLGDAMPQLLDIKAKTNVPVKFHVRVELGDGDDLPPQEVVDQVNELLAELKDDFRCQ